MSIVWLSGVCAPGRLSSASLSPARSSSPNAMGRVLVHLAMLSTASGWQLPQITAPEETITGEAHGGVDRRRLASACNGGWYVRPHARASPPCLTLLPSLVRSGTYGTSCECDSTNPSCDEHGFFHEVLGRGLVEPKLHQDQAMGLAIWDRTMLSLCLSKVYYCLVSIK